MSLPQRMLKGITRVESRGLKQGKHLPAQDGHNVTFTSGRGSGAVGLFCRLVGMRIWGRILSG